MLYITAMDIQIDQDFYELDKAKEYPPRLKTLTIHNFNFTKDAYLLLNIPKDLKEIKFITAKDFNFDFLRGMLKYLKKLERFELIKYD